MTPSVLANVAFLFLFLCYSAQLYFIQSRRKEEAESAQPEASSRKLSANEAWTYLAMSLLIPVLVGFLPEILGAALSKDPDVVAANPVLFIGVRLLTAYLVTVITLELAIQAQAVQAKRENPWLGLLLTNLGLDIVSILVLQGFKAVPSASTDGLVILFFLICLVPTVATGILVITRSYASITSLERANVR